MKANELRIDNWIYVPSIGDTYTDRLPYIEECCFKIDQLSQFAAIVDIGHGARQKVALDLDVKPILLTEEWLLKFGFKIVKEKSHPFSSIIFFHYENDNCWIYLIKEGFEMELNVGDERFNLFRTYKYVHQLQNLYFALTGKELEIN